MVCIAGELFMPNGNWIAIREMNNRYIICTNKYYVSYNAMYNIKPPEKNS